MSNGILTMLTMVTTSGCVLIFGIIHRLSYWKKSLTC